MTVLNREQVTDAQQPERAIFVAPDGRRARRLRRAAVVTALLACLWVVGLGLGMLGFGRLPGVSLVERVFEGPGGSGAHITPVSRNDAAQPASEPRSEITRRVASESARAQARQPSSRARPSTSSPREASRPPAAVLAPAPPAQQPVNPAQRQRGWARTGATAPPGQLRKTVPPPPPGTRGQRRGQTTTPTTTTPTPPGQAKKTEPPPPPPPPPEG